MIIRLENYNDLQFMNKNVANQIANENLNEERQTQVGGKKIFAGDLNIKPDEIALKKQKAQEKAMKIVGDAWDHEKKIDNDLNEKRQYIKDLENDAASAQEEVKKIKEKKNQLKENYGIADDSEEQKDLELLEKRRKNSNSLTEEERERLKEIDTKPLTDYQKGALEFDDMSDVWQKRVDAAQSKIIGEVKSIQGIKLARLKTHPIADAEEKADAIMEKASKEVVGMLIDEAKDHVEEVIEENKEDAEDDKAENEKEELQTDDKDSTRDERANMDSDTLTVQEAAEYNEIQMKVKQEVENIIEDFALLDEDLKGTSVDSQI